MEKYLADYDDDKEDALGQDEWFVDRQRWVEKRKYLLLREADQDERDRTQEKREHQQQEQQQAQDSTERTRRSERSRSPRRRDHAPRSSSEADAAAASAATASATGDDGNKEAPPLAPVVMRYVDLRKALQAVLRGPLAFLNPLAKESALDGGRAAAFSYQVEWQYLLAGLEMEEVVERRLRPLIDQKLEAFLGTQEPELVDFILESVLPKKGAAHENSVDPHTVLEEIMVAFGDGEEEKREAEDMVRLLWHAIIWEVEKRKAVLGGSGSASGGSGSAGSARRPVQVTGLDKPLHELEVSEIL